MSVDISGTNCDQCRSMIQCCFTSTETVRLIRTGSPGRPPRLSHRSSTLGLQSHLKDFHRVCTGFDSGEILGRVPSLTRKCYPSILVTTLRHAERALDSHHSSLLHQLSCILYSVYPSLHRPIKISVLLNLLCF